MELSHDIVLSHGVQLSLVLIVGSADGSGAQRQVHSFSMSVVLTDSDDSEVLPGSRGTD
jgi:hypothetical protein